MASFWSAARKSFLYLPIFAFTLGLANAQNCLMLSSARAQPDGTASLDLSLNLSSSGPPPAAVQWTFRYSSLAIRSITVDDGPVVLSAGKATFCAGDAATYKCLIAGANSNTIANGVIATVTAVLTPGAQTATIQVREALGVSIGGYPIAISSESGTITEGDRSSDRKLNRRPDPPVGRGSCSAPQQEKHK